MEHVYPSDPQALPLMKQTLVTGLEIKLERTHDLSAVIHAERLPDGRILITAMPLLYGSYTVTRGPGTFQLEPPLDLNLKAGWPLFKDVGLREAETRCDLSRERASAECAHRSHSWTGSDCSGPEADNELIRVEPADSRGNAKGRRRSRRKPTPTPKRREAGEEHESRGRLADAGHRRRRKQPPHRLRRRPSRPRPHPR